jgi:hypothetical protein
MILPSNMSELSIRILVLAAAVIQIVTPFFVNPFREGHQAFRVAEPSRIEPAAYAFAIWGPIYVLALAYAIWQLTPGGRADSLTLRIAPIAIALYLGSSLWLAAAKFGPFWATMPTLAAMAAYACTIFVSATSPTEPTTSRTWLMVVPFAIYAGWTTCAVFVNIAEVAPGYGFNRFGLSIPAYGVLSIAVAAMLAAVVLWLARGQLAFAATVIWALAAIMVAARERGADPEISVAAGAAIAVLLLQTFTLNVLSTRAH